MRGQIIFLHGPSSSGKSTTAKALQSRIELPFWHMSIDHLRDSGVLPTERIKTGAFNWPDMRASFFDGFHASLAAYAGAGNNLILEHILDTPGWVDDLKRLLLPFNVFFVGLHCDVDELNRRETERADRPMGSAEKDFHAVHIDRRYDLELNGRDPVETNVERILEGWRSGVRISEFSHSDQRMDP